MFNIGWTELLVVLVVALVIFGPGKLPEVGKTLGKALREFKGAINDIDADVKKEVNDLKEEVGDLKDAVDVKSTIEDLQKDIQNSIKPDLDALAADSKAGEKN